MDDAPNLVALGWLSRIVVGNTELAFPRRTLLAYDPRATRRGLVFVYNVKTSRTRAPDAAIREYARTHWGKHGAWGISSGDAPDVPSGARGRAIAQITYTTIKGGDTAVTDYVHEFERTLPRAVLVKGQLQIVGGSYRVESRGIVG